MKGILFSKDLIPKVLDGSKTVTRRVLNPQPDKDVILEEMCKTTPEGWQTVGRSYQWWDACKNDSEQIWKPRYHVGETVYLKESAKYSKYGGLWTFGDIFKGKNYLGAEVFVEYKAGGYKYFTLCETDKNKFKEGKRTSLFMPEWASRCKLTILEVSVQRLQEITEDEAVNEGVYGELGTFDISARFLFKELWNSLNKERGYSWEANPYVFRYHFQRIKE